MKNSLKIGIVGGAGPIAGMLLFEDIISICQHKYGCHKDADFPYIMLLNYPFTDMLHGVDVPAQRTQITNQLRDCFKKFIENKIDIIAIACNTLHAFLTPEIVNEVTDKGGKFVHMIKETAIKSKDFEDVFVLCSDTSAKRQLHKSFFDCSYPNPTFQTEVQELIDKTLTGTYNEKDVRQFVQKLNSFHDIKNHNEKTALVLGCTEFSVLHKHYCFYKHGLNDRIGILDTNRIVAEKICNLIF